MEELIRGSGKVKFFKVDKGWGGIETDDVPADVWVHFSAIEMPGFKQLRQGQRVEFECQRRQQDSWRYVATWVRPLD